jgi:hypothetical protein
MKRRVRRLAFHGHIRRTAALDDLCHRMTGGKGMEAVVVFGACRCSSGFGYFPGPIMSCGRHTTFAQVSLGMSSCTWCSGGDLQVATYPLCTLVLPLQEDMEPGREQCTLHAPGALVDAEPRAGVPSAIPT